MFYSPNTEHCEISTIAEVVDDIIGVPFRVIWEETLAANDNPSEFTGCHIHNILNSYLMSY